MSCGCSAQRLFVRAPLRAGAAVELGRAQANYLLKVLRMKGGAPVLVFNGRDGEWRARIEPSGKKGCVLAVQEQTREQPPSLDLDYLFAPLKHARLDYMVQKAVEMGAGRLRPVLTRRTQAARVNLERMHANAIEAAEQCGVLTVPEIAPPSALEAVLGGWDPARRLIFCDEKASISNPTAALETIERGVIAVLVGPEGGFSPEERDDLLARPYVTAISLGPRILRADTAAVAALAVIQSRIGDWR